MNQLNVCKMRRFWTSRFCTVVSLRAYTHGEVRHFGRIYCRLKVCVAAFSLLYWLFWTLSWISLANRSRSGPKSVHMHSSRADNVHEILGAISADKMWARTCHQLPGFFCQQYETTFLATLQWSVFTKFGPDTWLGDETQILDRNLWKFPFTVICPQNPKLGGGQTVTSLKSRLQVKGCTAKRYCLLHVVVQEPESFWGQLFCTTYGCRATGRQNCPIYGFWPIFPIQNA